MCEALRIIADLLPLRRLDQKKKELLQQKEELLRQSKAKATTMDNVKIQIDILMKVRSPVINVAASTQSLFACLIGRNRGAEESHRPRKQHSGNHHIHTHT